MTIKSTLDNKEPNIESLRVFPYLAKSRAGTIVLLTCTNPHNKHIGCGIVIVNSCHTDDLEPRNVVGEFRQDWILSKFDPLFPDEVVCIGNI
jgi:hypothetical protein